MEILPGVPFNEAAFGLVTAAMNGIGVGLKKFKRFPDEHIPNALAVVGTVLYPVVVKDYQPVTFIIGFVSAVSAVGLNQLWKQNTPPAPPAPPAPATP